jgi:NADH-quinone oxidoreductase subunit E
VLSDEARRELTAILTKYPDRRSAVIAALSLAQEGAGHLTDEDMREVARLLGMNLTEVRSVAGFYTLLRTEPDGRHILQVCTDLPCALRGSETFLRRLCDRLGIKPGETTPDGLLTVEEVMCVAACDRAPVMQVDLEYHENLTDEKVDELLSSIQI